MRRDDAAISIAGVHDELPETLIYRTEVLAIIGALADLVVDVRGIRSHLRGDDEEEEEQEGEDG